MTLLRTDNALSVTAPPTMTRAERKGLVAHISSVWDSQPARVALSEDETARLAEARHAIHAQDLSLASSMLEGQKSAEALNLLGVVAEASGKHAEARQFYQKALAADRLLSAAEFNLRRCFELWALGRSNIPYAL